MSFHDLADEILLIMLRHCDYRTIGVARRLERRIRPLGLLTLSDSEWRRSGSNMLAMRTAVWGEKNFVSTTTRASHNHLLYPKHMQLDDGLLVSISQQMLDVCDTQRGTWLEWLSPIGAPMLAAPQQGTEARWRCAPHAHSMYRAHCVALHGDRLAVGFNERITVWRVDRGSGATCERVIRTDQLGIVIGLGWAGPAVLASLRETRWATPAASRLRLDVLLLLADGTETTLATNVTPGKTATAFTVDHVDGVAAYAMEQKIKARPRLDRPTRVPTRKPSARPSPLTPL